MPNGIEERIGALAPEWKLPPGGEATDPVEMFKMVEWYPSIRDALVKTRLNTVATVYSSRAAISSAYADAAKQVLEQLENIKAVS